MKMVEIESRVFKALKKSYISVVGLQVSEDEIRTKNYVLKRYGKRTLSANEIRLRGSACWYLNDKELLKYYKVSQDKVRDVTRVNKENITLYLDGFETRYDDILDKFLEEYRERYKNECERFIKVL